MLPWRRKDGADRPRAAKSPRRRAPASAGKDGDAAPTVLNPTLALVIAVVAFLVAAALFPIGILGARVSGLFPAGNPVGDVGEALKRLLSGAIGLGSAAIPLGLMATAATIGGWWSPQARRSAWTLTAALLAFLPLGADLAGARESLTGVAGRAMGGPLIEAVGRPAGWVLYLTAVVVAAVAAFRFDPLRPPSLAAGLVMRGVRWGGRGTRAAAGSWLARLREERAARRKEAARKEAVRKSEREETELAGRRRGRGAAGWKLRSATLGLGATGKASESAAASESRPAPDAPHGNDGESGPVPENAARDQDAARDRDGSPEDPAPAPSPTPAPPSAVHPLQATEDKPWRPPSDLLTAPAPRNRVGMDDALDQLGRVLVKTLRTFNVGSEISGRTTGPVITQYEVVPAAGVKVNRIANLDADLALAMRARSVRIVAPIPGKGAVGVEIPNPHPEMVRLREVLEAPAYSGSRAALPLALGRDLGGEPWIADLARMPHALIAGATGSGKSVCLNTVIASLVYRHGPDRLRLLLIDPKMVELSAYADLPHLRHPVVTDPKEAAGVLKWAVLEMERRYALLSANGVRSLREFNARVERGVSLRAAEPDGPEQDPGRWDYRGGALPWIVVVVDELADLMMTVQAEVEKPLTQLAQKARAIGIHLLVATQRPSVNVITGLIKANFPCRIAFRVASKTDSRTILDQNGADSLLGAGDMLFLPPGRSEPVRIQGAYLSTDETEALMSWYRGRAASVEGLERARAARAEADILEEVRELEGEAGDGDAGGGWGDWDELFREAALVCIQNGGGSTSLLQRRLRIGYGRAARVVDQLHDAGVLGPPDGSKPREVLVGADSLDEICPA